MSATDLRAEAERLCALAEDHGVAERFRRGSLQDPATLVQDLAKVTRALLEENARLLAERDQFRLAWETLKDEQHHADETQPCAICRALADRGRLRAEANENQRIAASRDEIVAASKEALKLLRHLTEHEDGPWRPEIVRLDEALVRAGEIDRSTL